MNAERHDRRWHIGIDSAGRAVGRTQAVDALEAQRPPVDDTDPTRAATVEEPIRVVIYGTSSADTERLRRALGIADDGRPFRVIIAQTANEARQTEVDVAVVSPRLSSAGFYIEEALRLIQDLSQSLPVIAWVPESLYQMEHDFIQAGAAATVYAEHLDGQGSQIRSSCARPSGATPIGNTSPERFCLNRRSPSGLCYV